MDVNPLVKDLEVYRDDAPPARYSIATEIDGVLRAADEAGVERFHLYGHSAGGAIALNDSGAPLIDVHARHRRGP